MNYSRIALFGSLFGIRQILPVLPHHLICGIVAPGNRENEIDELRLVADQMKVPLLLHHRYDQKQYKEFISCFKSVAPNLIVSNSYSMILKKDLLEIVPDAINIHWSLLPKNRGPNPIQWAIIKGEMETGVTIHFIDEGIDTGKIISQRKVIINFGDTWVQLFNKLSDVSLELIIDTILRFLENGAIGNPQKDTEATVNCRLDPDFPRIDFSNQTDIDIYNLIRAQCFL